jgi:hypothetical protein
MLPTTNASARAPTTATLPNETPRTILNSLRRHPNIYNDQTLLLDISPAHWGIFTGESPSYTFIPEKFVRKTRHVWCKFIQKLLDDSSSENWKKVLLLPIVLFDSDRNISLNEKKKSLGEKLIKLSNDDWSTFNLGSLSKRTIKTNILSEEEIYSAATRLAEAGEIGKAFKKLKSDRNRVVPSIEVLQKLQSKFPEPGLPNLSNEEINSIYNFNVPNNDELEDHEASDLESSIEKVIRKAKKLSAHGIDR